MEKGQVPPREVMDEAFHMLQDEIIRIAVEEEQDRMKEEIEGK